MKSSLPKSSKEALLVGSAFYFTGQPCQHGVLAKRRAQDRRCTCQQCVNRRRMTMRPGRQRWNKANRAYLNEFKRNREFKKRASTNNLTPQELESIRNLYWMAWALTILTGMEYQVDHIVPLNHPLVCGLHRRCNLQVITARENRAKGNSFEQPLYPQLQRAA